MQIDPNASGALAGAVNAATAQVNAPATAQANAQAPALATSRTPRWFRHAAARRETAAPWAGRMLKHGMVRAQPVRGAWLSRIRAALQQRADRAEHGAQLRHEALRPTEGSLPVRGKFGWLSRLGLVRQRLQGTVVNLQAQQAAAADALALSRVSSAMQQRFAASASDAGAFNATLRQAFGDKFDAAKAETLRQQALAGDFSWAPKVQIASAQQLSDLSGTQAADGAARGAYVQAEDTIISRETLHGDADTAQRLLMEELGHAIDARINTVDSAGDEGEIFAKLMHGDAVSAQQLADMKADNDHGTVMLNGRSVQVEYGWFKKLRKAISGGFKKIVKAVVKGAVSVVKSTFKVATGLMTLNFQRVREGFKQGVQAVKTTVKAVVQAVKETTKAVISAVKEGFKQLMQSKLFAAVLMICRFIPIPVVQLAVRIVDVVRAATALLPGHQEQELGCGAGRGGQRGRRRGQHCRQRGRQRQHGGQHRGRGQRGRQAEHGLQRHRQQGHRRGTQPGRRRLRQRHAGLVHHRHAADRGRLCAAGRGGACGARRRCAGCAQRHVGPGRQRHGQGQQLGRPDQHRQRGGDRAARRAGAWPRPARCGAKAGQRHGRGPGRQPRALVDRRGAARGKRKPRPAAQPQAPQPDDAGGSDITATQVQADAAANATAATPPEAATQRPGHHRGQPRPDAGSHRPCPLRRPMARRPGADGHRQQPEAQPVGQPDPARGPGAADGRPRQPLRRRPGRTRPHRRPPDRQQQRQYWP
ncbi:hypothetical protein [Aquabacterium sp. OR-4]|uniref:hypothetical protein n=1 Tax=Aquabacterium sp. OR-4 TaxID=2978127 RepID=UPI0028C64C4D|nr:hypothetical protein [Aquabacterium sp. OR-4]MDT7839084.1 hypothetical protein [Aquabacterium sp. OR-4]